MSNLNTGRKKKQLEPEVLPKNKNKKTAIKILQICIQNTHTRAYFKQERLKKYLKKKQT